MMTGFQQHLAHWYNLLAKFYDREELHGEDNFDMNCLFLYKVYWSIAWTIVNFSILARITFNAEQLTYASYDAAELCILLLMCACFLILWVYTITHRQRYVIVCQRAHDLYSVAMPLGSCKSVSCKGCCERFARHVKHPSGALCVESSRRLNFLDRESPPSGETTKQLTRWLGHQLLTQEAPEPEKGFCRLCGHDNVPLTGPQNGRNILRVHCFDCTQDFREYCGIDGSKRQNFSRNCWVATWFTGVILAHGICFAIAQRQDSLVDIVLLLIVQLLSDALIVQSECDTVELTYQP